MKNFILLYLFFLLLSCSSKEKNIPADIIEQKELTLILADLHLAQQELTTKLKSDKPAATHDDYLELVLQRHKISREKFLSSLKFYSNNPGDLEWSL